MHVPQFHSKVPKFLTLGTNPILDEFLTFTLLGFGIFRALGREGGHKIWWWNSKLQTPLDFSWAKIGHELLTITLMTHHNSIIWKLEFSNLIFGLHTSYLLSKAHNTHSHGWMIMVPKLIKTASCASLFALNRKIQKCSKNQVSHWSNNPVSLVVVIIAFVLRKMPLKSLFGH